MTQTLKKEDLQQFYGDDIRYRHSLSRHVIYTPGVKYLVDAGEAHWLIDAIASYLMPSYMGPVIAEDARVKSLHFWRLTVAADNSALLEARVDSPCKPFVRQEIEFTDFPLESADIWAGFNGEHWTLYLPSEH